MSVCLSSQYRRGKKSLCQALLVAVSLSAAQAFAEYKDPIDMPALKMPSSQYSLLLDITQAGERLVAVGERGHALYSQNDGQSWTQVDVASRSQMNAVYFQNDKLGWAVGEDATVLHTADGGISWQHQYDARDADMRGPLLDVFFSDELNGFAVGVFNKIVRTSDGGKTWQNWQDHVDNLDEWHLFSIAAASESNLYITSEMGLLFRSLDGGESFSEMQSDHDGSFHGILVRQDAQGIDQLVAYGVGGVLYTSVDAGESWNRVDTNTEDGLSGAAWQADGSAVIVGASGVVVTLDNELMNAVTTHTDSGYPMSSVVVTSESTAVTAGLAGVQPLVLGQ